MLGMLVERLQTTSRAQVAGLHTQLVAVLQGACTACFCSGNDVSGADVPALLQLDCTVRSCHVTDRCPTLPQCK